MATRYNEIAQWLRDRIGDGTYPPGEKIPAIPELMDRFDVARDTVRDAVSRLTHEGLVTPRRGVGTVVRDLSPVNVGYRPEAPARVWAAQTESGTDQLVSAEWEQADRGVAERLEVPVNSQVVHRVRHQSKGRAIAQVHEQWVPEATARSIQEQGTNLADAQTPPTTDMFSLMRQAGDAPTTVTEAVSTRMPAPDERELMELPEGVPVLITYRTTRNSGSTPLETSTFVGAGDRMSQTFTVPIE